MSDLKEQLEREVQEHNDLVNRIAELRGTLEQAEAERLQRYGRITVLDEQYRASEEAQEEAKPESSNEYEEPAEA
jgi:hypothetical protein